MLAPSVTGFSEYIVGINCRRVRRFLSCAGVPKLTSLSYHGKRSTATWQGSGATLAVFAAVPPPPITDGYSGPKCSLGDAPVLKAQHSCSSIDNFRENEQSVEDVTVAT